MISNGVKDNQQKFTNFGQEFASWSVLEYEKHERSQNWYIAAGVIVFALLVYCYFSANFLFAVIIMMGSFVLVMNDSQNPGQVKISLTSEGVVVGRKFYDYDEIKDFAIVYKPNQGIKRLYFEFNSSVRPRISISLENMNPLPIRENLLKYLKEDLERTNEPLSEGLAKLLKL